MASLLWARCCAYLLDLWLILCAKRQLTLAAMGCRLTRERVRRTRGRDIICGLSSVRLSLVVSVSLSVPSYFSLSNMHKVDLPGGGCHARGPLSFHLPHFLEAVEGLTRDLDFPQILKNPVSLAQI